MRRLLGRTILLVQASLKKSIFEVSNSPTILILRSRTGPFEVDAVKVEVVRLLARTGDFRTPILTKRLRVEEGVHTSTICNGRRDQREVA